MFIYYILSAFGGALLALTIYLVTKRIIMKGRRDEIIEKAELEAENIKKEKILQAKEKFLQLKSEHEKYVNQKNSEIRLIKCGEKGNPENAEYDDRQTESPSHDMPEEVKQAIGAASDDDDIFEI